MDLAKNLKIDSVSRLHPTPPLQVGPQQAVGDAVELMRREQVGCVLISSGRWSGDLLVAGLPLLRRLKQKLRPAPPPPSDPCA